jgi:hypothetical protein
VRKFLCARAFFGKKKRKIRRSEETSEGNFIGKV